jgi:protein-tyrosine phosphatase
MSDKTKVLFVCLGNICRSPSAEGVFRSLVHVEGLTESIEVDSCGTAGWHVSKHPDKRAQAAAKNRGVDISRLEARSVTTNDFYDFDYILAMDEENLSDLERICPEEQTEKLSLMLAHDSSSGLRSVPDPYYGSDSGFDDMLDLIEGAAAGLLRTIKKKL